MLATSNRDRALDALHAIPADLPRDEWVKVGMAAHAAGLGFEDFDAWSSQGTTYSKGAAQAAWKSFKADQGIGAGTLFKAAAQNGWRFNGQLDRGGPAKASKRPQEASALVPAGAIDPLAVWARCEEATTDHPYIQQKGGVPDGLRVVPADDPLTIAGHRMAGALAVPVRRLDGSLSTLQLIAAPETAARLKAEGRPGKLNLPGCKLDGWHVVGDLAGCTSIYACEGIGQAWAAWKATGVPAVACFGWGRVNAVVSALRQAFPTARLVVVPDVGKERESEQIARQVGGETAFMPDGWPPNSDINDLMQREGLAALHALLERAEAPAQRYRLLSGPELLATPAMPWRVRGVFPATGIAAIFGPSASGKSFLAMDLAAAIASGDSWFSCRVKSAPVVYAALEGEGGFRARVQAWEMNRGRPLPANLRLMVQPFRLTEADDVRDLAAVVPSGAVVFIDTLNRAAPTSDENSSKDMGEILEATKKLQALTDGLVVLIHHTGKDAAKGLRGHSSLFAALDAAVEVGRDGDRREWRVAKSKDSEDGLVKAFRLQVELLGVDDLGDARTSCVVVPDGGTEEVRRAKLPTGGNQRLVLDSLRPLFKGGQPGKVGAPPLSPCIELEAAITHAAGHLTCESHRRATRAREAITGLVGRGVLGCHDGWLWHCP